MDKIWNLVIEGHNVVTGKETHYSVDSFIKEEDARTYFHQWLDEDKRNPNHRVDDTDIMSGIYTYTNECGEKVKIRLVHSHIF